MQLMFARGGIILGGLLVVVGLFFGIKALIGVVTKGSEDAAKEEQKADGAEGNIMEIPLSGNKTLTLEQIFSGAGVASEETVRNNFSDGEAKFSLSGDIIVNTKYNYFEGYEPYNTDATSDINLEEVDSVYAILVDLDTGEVVLDRRADEKMYPASMTKVLTVLTAAENISDYSDTFMVTEEITNFTYSHECSEVGFSIGEEVPIYDLMYGTILPSGGDAAMSLATYTAGTVDAFVDLMNRKVSELGLADTAHFTNPIGLYDDNNYCTVKDMAMIMKAAIENDITREVLSTHRYTTSKTYEHPEGIDISNWFLRRIEDKDTGGEVLCAKTGFVVQSRNCAVSYFISNSGKNYICCTGGAHSAWRCIYDHVAIYSHYTE